MTFIKPFIIYFIFDLWYIVYFLCSVHCTYIDIYYNIVMKVKFFLFALIKKTVFLIKRDLRKNFNKQTTKSIYIIYISRPGSREKKRVKYNIKQTKSKTKSGNY